MTAAVVEMGGGVILVVGSGIETLNWSNLHPVPEQVLLEQHLFLLQLAKPPPIHRPMILRRIKMAVTQVVVRQEGEVSLEEAVRQARRVVRIRDYLLPALRKISTFINYLYTKSVTAIGEWAMI